jgi:hypothetical protein
LHKPFTKPFDSDFMQNTIVNPSTDAQMQSLSLTVIPYEEAEQQFADLIEVEDLDRQLSLQPSLTEDFKRVLDRAIAIAYSLSDELTSDRDPAHRFIQRVLYRINRLKFFWYDDLRRYSNERSPYLMNLRNRIEAVWQEWELAQMDLAALKLDSIDAVKQALSDRAAADLNPALSEDSRYLREEMTVAGYRQLLAIASFDGLVEASRLSRILGGAANEIQCTLARVLIEEYGGGRFNRKHSTFFAKMLEELGLHTEPEAYFDLVPWEVLACINQNFLLTERKRHFLRYNGGLAYFEVAGPAAYRNYLAAAQRLQLSDAAMGYWDLHIREDERHGRWMMDDVTLPLVDRYPNDGWELLLGYDQEKQMGDRAGAAVVRSVREADQSERMPIG